MKMKRKFISLLTVICMVLGIMPQVAFGMSGSGTEADPYQIGTADDLFAFASKVNGGEKGAKAVLTADIDLQDRPWTTMCETGLYWKSYGTDMGYTGTFDGQGHTIKNLALENSATADATCGLFGTVSGEVKNLGIENMTFKVVGEKDFRVGAIVGQLIKSTGRISNCWAANVIIPENVRVAGGIAGCTYEGTIEYCMVYGSDIHGSHPGNDYRYGYIVGDTRGDNSTSDRVGIVKNCYTDGSYACGSQSGSSNITGCEANVSADRFSNGEIAYKLQGTQSEQIWGQTLDGAKIDSYPRINGAKVYKTECADGTSCFGNQDTPYTYHTYKNAVCIRCGHEETIPCIGGGVFQISTAEQLKAFASMVNAGQTSKPAILMEDISVSTAEGFIPIGTAEHKYGGTFDGQNHTITVDLTGGDNTALFAYAEGATIENLTTAGTITVMAKFAAGFVGQAYGNINLENCISKVTINSTFHFSDKTLADGTHGGLIGVVNSGQTTINNCAFLGAMYGNDTNRCGGMVGWTNGTTAIKNSYVAGSYTIYASGCNTFSRNSEKVTLNNCYYLTRLEDTPEDVGAGASQLTAEQFASGEAAWLLNGSKDNGAWKQSARTDKFPGLTGSPVYKNTCEGQEFYGSTDKDYASHSYSNEICTRCGAIEPKELEQIDSVYQIRNAAQMKKFADKVNGGEYGAKGVLLNNIDLSPLGTWTPIGSSNEKAFTGTFNGDGHKISGMYINKRSIMWNDYGANGHGLFSYIKGGAVVKNLNVEGSVKGVSDIGGVVGNVGGGATVENCSFSGSILGANDTGGVVGYNSGTVKGCYNTASVNASYMTGGIVGYNSGAVVNCYNSGTVTGEKFTGGINGTNGGTNRAANCYNTGTVSGINYTGSITGEEGVTNCYYLEGGAGGAGTAKTAEEFASGEVAFILQSTQTEQVWGQNIGVDSSPTLGGKKVYQTYTDCITPSGYTNTETQPPHKFNENGVCTVCGAYEPSIQDEKGIYHIKSEGNMLTFANIVNGGEKGANAVLEADISVSTNDAFVPVGTEAHKYSGKFDGGNHTITVTLSGENNIALFAFAEGATIENLTTAGTINVSGQFAAGFVGQLWNGITLKNCISKVTIASTRSGDGTHGGFIGVANSGQTKIENCAFLGAINGSTTNCCGGMVGWTNQNGSTAIKNSYVAGSFTVKADGSDTFSRNPNYVTLTNCYYLNLLNSVKEGAEQRDEAQFKSGEVAYLLQNGQTEADGVKPLVWGQDLKSDVKDEYPVLTSDPAKKVYKVTYINGGTTEEKYSNKALMLEPAPEGKAWAKENGETAKNGEELTADITLYAKTAYTVQVIGGLIGSETSAVVAQGQSVTITPDEAIAGFVTDDESLVMPNAEGKFIFTPVKDSVLSGRKFGVSLKDGAQVRIGQGVDANTGLIKQDLKGSGLRFIATVDREDSLAVIKDAQVGILIYPADVTITDFNSAIANKNKNVVVIPAETYQDPGVDSIFSVALTNLHESNYNRKFTAKPYVKIGETYYTNDQSVTRSIYQVAAGLLANDENVDVTVDKTTLKQVLGDKGIAVLNAYLNQVGIRLTIDNIAKDGTVKFRTEGETGAYSGDVFFEIDETNTKALDEGKYTITLKAKGNATFKNFWKEYVRINNNHSAVMQGISNETITVDGKDATTLTFTFDYSTAKASDNAN